MKQGETLLLALGKLRDEIILRTVKREIKEFTITFVEVLRLRADWTERCEGNKASMRRKSKIPLNILAMEELCIGIFDVGVFGVLWQLRS